MNADILKPFFDQVLAHFDGDYSVKVQLELVQKFYPDDNGKRMGDREWSCFIFLNDELFHGATLEEAFEAAKAGFKIIDPARVKAADELRAQADAIERGEAPIPVLHQLL